MDEIRIFPDPVLMEPAQPVRNMDGHVKEIVDRMIACMCRNGGIGLAAPQIGIPSQIIVVSTEKGSETFMNPELMVGDGECLLEEGCLSLPKMIVPVKRKEKIFVRGWNLDEQEINLEISGLPARVYQHEIDHLRGILIIDHLSGLKRKLLVRKMIKEQKRSQRKSQFMEARRT
jgi:peptide deformylase